MPLRDFMCFFAFCKGKISYKTLFKYYKVNIAKMQKNKKYSHIFEGTVQKEKWKTYNEQMIKQWGNKDTNHVYDYCFDYISYYLRKGTRRKSHNNNRFKDEPLLDILPLINIGYEEFEFWITKVLTIPYPQQQKKLLELKCMSNTCELETHCDMIEHLNDYKIPWYVKLVIYIYILTIFFTLYYTYFVSWKPYQCNGKSPAYPSTTKGGQDRARLETNPQICQFSSNTGKYLKQPTWNMGTLNIEYINKLQNVMKEGSSGKTMINKIKNVKFAQFLLLYEMYRYHSKQNCLPAEKRAHPEYDTCKQNHKNMFSAFDFLFQSFISGELFRLSLHSTEIDVTDHFDKTVKKMNKNNNNGIEIRYTLMPTLNITKNVNKAIEQKIINDGLVLNNDKKWNQKLTFGMYRLIKKNGWHKDLTNDTMHEIIKNNVAMVRKKYMDAGVNTKLITKNLLKERMFKILKKYL